MRTRSPTIHDNGHTWRSDATAMERAKRIAPIFKLKPSGVEREIRERGCYEVTLLDILDTLLPSNDDLIDRLSHERTTFQIGSVLMKEDSSSLSELFDIDHPEGERHRLGQPWLNRSHGDRMVLTSRSSNSNAIQGIMVYDRTLRMLMEEREFEYRYKIELANFYVAPDARQEGVGYSLATAAALDIADDIRQISAAFRRSKQLLPRKVLLGFEIGGDAYTNGGARLCRQIVTAVRSRIEREFSSAEVDRYMLGEALEEDFSGNYYFDDEVGDPPDQYDSAVVGWQDGRSTAPDFKR